MASNLDTLSTPTGGFSPEDMLKYDELFPEPGATYVPPEFAQIQADLDIETRRTNALGLTDFESVRAAKDAFADTFRRELDTGAESSEEIALTMGMLSSLTMREQLLATHKLERAGDADKLAPRTLESRRYADVAMLGELAVSPRLTESQSKLVLDAIDKQVALVKDSDPEAYAKKTSLQSGRMYVQQQTASSYQPKHAR